MLTGIAIVAVCFFAPPAAANAPAEAAPVVQAAPTAPAVAPAPPPRAPSVDFADPFTRDPTRPQARALVFADPFASPQGAHRNEAPSPRAWAPTDQQLRDNRRQRRQDRAYRGSAVAADVAWWTLGWTVPWLALGVAFAL